MWILFSIFLIGGKVNLCIAGCLNDRVDQLPVCSATAYPIRRSLAGAAARLPGCATARWRIGLPRLFRLQIPGSSNRIIHRRACAAAPVVYGGSGVSKARAFYSFSRNS